MIETGKDHLTAETSSRATSALSSVSLARSDARSTDLRMIVTRGER